jgi:hypothetical protein
MNASAMAQSWRLLRAAVEELAPTFTAGLQYDLVDVTRQVSAEKESLERALVTICRRF